MRCVRCNVIHAQSTSYLVCSLNILLCPHLQVRDDVTLNLAHNFGNKATKTGITVDTKVGGKKTTLKAKYITKGNAFTGEVVSSIAPNKKATINFTEREVCNNQFLFEAFFIDRAMMLARLCLTWFATC